MNKVYQKIIDKGQGDCMQCVMATLFNLEYEDVPKFISFGTEWFGPFYKFLQDQGYDYLGPLYNNVLQKEHYPESKDRFPEIKNMEGVNGLFYASVYSPKYYNPDDKYPTTHAVIINKDFEIVHDPNPGYKGLKEYPLSEKIGYGGLLDIYMIEKIIKRD